MSCTNVIIAIHMTSIHVGYWHKKDHVDLLLAEYM